jgi:hypothetical protein
VRAEVDEINRLQAKIDRLEAELEAAAQLMQDRSCSQPLYHVDSDRTPNIDLQPRRTAYGWNPEKSIYGYWLDGVWAGTSYRDVFRTAAKANLELKRITPSNAELLKLAERNPAPQEWYDEKAVETKGGKP